MLIPSYVKYQFAGVPGVTKALFLTGHTTLAKEKNKFNAPSNLYTCGLCGKGFGSSEAHAQHLNSRSHITRVIQDGHLNERTTIAKTLAPQMANKLSKNQENNKLNAPSKLYTCGLCGKGFGSSKAYAQHLNSQSHMTRAIQDCHLNESTTVKTLAPHMVNKLSQNEENNKLNAPSKLYTCGLRGKGFGSSEAHAQHLNSQSHITRAIQDGHLNESTTIVKTLAPHMVNKLSQNEEKNKLNAPSKLYTCGLSCKGFGSSEVHAQHLNSHPHITRVIQGNCHLNENTAIVKTLAPDMANKLSQNEDEWEEVYESNEWEEVDGSDEWEEVDVSDEWEEVGE
ncbi:zinc finger protein [Tanacetum coccineum]